MFSVTFTTADVAAVAGVLLPSVLVWAAVFARDPDRREAAQRVLAMFWRHKHIPTVQYKTVAPPALVSSDANEREPGPWQ